MTIEEFCREYGGDKVLRYRQATMDLMDEIERTLKGGTLPLSNRVLTCRYILGIFTEVYDRSLPDYAYLLEALHAIPQIREEGKQ